MFHFMKWKKQRYLDIKLHVFIGEMTMILPMSPDHHAAPFPNAVPHMVPLYVCMHVLMHWGPVACGWYWGPAHALVHCRCNVDSITIPSGLCRNMPLLPSRDSRMWSAEPFTHWLIVWGKWLCGGVGVCYGMMYTGCSQSSVKVNIHCNMLINFCG